MSDIELVTPDPVATAQPSLVTTIGVTLATRRNARRRNEDAVGVGGWVLQGDSPVPVTLTVPVPPGGPVLIAVADGMGGHPAGDLAARIVADHLTRGGPRSSPDLPEAFRRADEAVHATASPEGPGMGATASLVRLTGSGATSVGNVGDVRVYRPAGGYLGRLTVDDRVHDPLGNTTGTAVTRCLGGPRRTVVEPHVHHQQLRPGDRLLICSDGLHDAVAPAQLAEIVAGEARAAAERLVAAAGDSGDNVTVVVVDLHGAADGEVQPVPVAEPETLPPAVASAIGGVLSAPSTAGRAGRGRREPPR